MSAGDAALSVIAYCLCSGTMLLLNKLAIFYLGHPTIVSTIQIFSTAAWCIFTKYLRLIEIDDFEWTKMKPYLYYVLLFVFGVWTNMKSLEVSNVDTVIVFRACTPLVVAVLDTLFLGRDYPSKRSLCCLILLGIGALGYVQADAEFKMQGFAAYYYVATYFVIICIEMTYGKRITSSVKMNTVSGSVMYTNTFAWILMLALAFYTGEYESFHEIEWSKVGVFFLLLSCVVGTAISYCGWWCRAKVSATTFTLVGVVNKIFTVLMNIAIWDKHASTTGICFLALCLVGGTFYRQAPLREKDKLPSFQLAEQKQQERGKLLVSK